MISLTNVERFYPTGPSRTYVLRQITLDIREGEFVTIMGPSGAGKSTLLSVLGMLDHGWTGEFRFLGEAVHALPPKKRIELNKRYIGFVFQKYHLLDDLTVYENLEIPLSYRDVKPKERAAIVAETLDRFQMVGKKDLYPSQLSGRSTAARRRRSRGHRKSEAPAGGRTDGQPAQRAGWGDHGVVHASQPAGRDDRAGDALGTERVLLSSDDSAPRRVDRRAGAAGARASLMAQPLRSSR